MKRAVVVAIFAGISACATVAPGPRYYPPQSVQFDPATVTWARVPGNNTISGNAVMRTVGGEVRTCAGGPAGVIAVSPYSSERMRMVFGNDQRGYTPANNLMEFPGAPPGYSEANHQVTCDSQGNFQIDRLPDGDYYVISTVVWGVPMGSLYYSYTSTQGGAVMQRVHVSGGQTLRVVLTN